MSDFATYLKEKEHFLNPTFINGRCHDCIGCKKSDTGTPFKYSWMNCYIRKMFKEEKAYNCQLIERRYDLYLKNEFKVGDKVRVYRTTFSKKSFLVLDEYQEGTITRIGCRTDDRHYDIFPTMDIAVDRIVLEGNEMDWEKTQITGIDIRGNNKILLPKNIHEQLELII